MTFAEPMPQMFTRSNIMILDFAQIPADLPPAQNIQLFFEDAKARGVNPRLPESRQAFNNDMLQATGMRYLVSRYGEDRVAMLADTPAGREGRTLHMALDIFSQNLEPVMAPCNGTIVRSDYEEGFGEYGNYLILQPHNADFYIFFGHLAADRHTMGEVRRGEIIAHLGDYHNSENGGWSRHLHLQILKQLPAAGHTPNGYSSRQNFTENSQLYPNPELYFKNWQIK